jgi:GTP pyrophosphokinase
VRSGKFRTQTSAIPEENALEVTSPDAIAQSVNPMPPATPPEPRVRPRTVGDFCYDRAGLLKEFTAITSDDGTNIRSSASNATADGGAVVETVDVRHLNRLVDKLRRVHGVRDVQRIQKI